MGVIIDFFCAYTVSFKNEMNLIELARNCNSAITCLQLR